jgi:hypothetical protein
MQTVQIAIGDPVVASAIQSILKSLCDPGILTGFELSASAADTLTINPGAALTDSGVMILETEQQNEQFTLSVAPANYTVFYSYVPTNNFGGNPATLTIQPGLVPASGFTNGVLLGWIIYPGGSAPLDPATMFLSAPRLRISRDPALGQSTFQNLYAPFSGIWSQLSLSGPTPTINEGYNATYKAPVTKILNGGGTVMQVSYVVPFTVPRLGLGQVALQIQTDQGTLVTLTVLDNAGNVITPNGINFFTNSAMSKNILTIPGGNGLVPNSQMFLQLAFKINPTFSASLQSMGISSYTDPF